MDNEAVKGNWLAESRRLRFPTSQGGMPGATLIEERTRPGLAKGESPAYAHCVHRPGWQDLGSHIAEAGRA